MHETTFAQLETMFLALGDKTRLRLLALMADGPVAVGFLADRLKESQPKVSRHLAYLRNAGMVTTSRDGKWVYYGIRYPPDPSQSRILESLISSIAVIRADGEDVYMTEKDFLEPQSEYIYAEAYTQDASHNSWATAYEESGRKDDDELEVFLL